MCYKCVGKNVTLICQERGIIIVAPTGVEPSCMARLAQFPPRTSTYTAGRQTRGLSIDVQVKFGIESHALPPKDGQQLFFYTGLS